MEFVLIDYLSWIFCILNRFEGIPIVSSFKTKQDGLCFLTYLSQTPH